MSRSNPTSNAPSPCNRFHEWDGENGKVRYYDKELAVPGKEKKGGNVVVGDKFTFLVLDELATIGGWHEASKCGIYANEVRDTRAEPFLVKTFKGLLIANGLYAQIKDRVAAADGYYKANIYIGFKDGNDLKMGALQLKGAALNAWVEFRKKHRVDVQTKAVAINGSTEGKKGKVVFRTPNFFIKEITPETNEQAIALDKELQAYLTEYFKRSTTAKADTAVQHAPVDSGAQADPGDEPPLAEPDEAGNSQFDDIPF